MGVAPNGKMDRSLALATLEYDKYVKGLQLLFIQILFVFYF